jgi:hypothetical protein
MRLRLWERVRLRTEKAPFAGKSALFSAENRERNPKKEGGEASFSSAK